MTMPRHIPVLHDEVIAALSPAAGCRYVDGTFGAGGYSSAILDAADCTVTGIDRDPQAIAEAAPLVTKYSGRLSLVQGRFGMMDRLVDGRVDGIALDLGVSSMQLDRADRGFSFRQDGPLDMRMSREGRTASDLVNQAEEAELADLIFLYGEERHARRIAREIVRVRTTAPFETTKALAEAVRRSVPGKWGDIDPATRTFQALRIAVNDEMGELEQGLAAAETILNPGGVLAVVTFHSLEDRVVKAFFRTRSGEDAAPSRHLPASGGGKPATFVPLARKPVAPTEAEIARNPRARSAKLRAARRTEAAAWGVAA
jgi:16S rRNA (cytosine1402-N4)-methyltransferase